MDQWISKLDTQEAIKSLESTEIKQQEVKETKPVKDNSLSIVMEITDDNQKAVFSHKGLLFVVCNKKSFKIFNLINNKQSDL